ncbi:MAG TPA: alkyl sulfatase dimerization domain-containing protein, partial [Xanthobacteraceae bacterium]|nr:alkyl sulfatase dimerization domain-containing protein [Xanthobacteraceae bacterium]
FDGNATNIFPLSPAERAAKVLDMAGGVDGVLSLARKALDTGEFQWAAELADYVLAVETKSALALQLKAIALTELGQRQVNATARNYYLTSAQFLMKN